MPRSATLFFTIFALVLGASFAHAQTPSQTFNYRQQGGRVDYAYRYQTPQNTSQELFFSLNADDIQRGSREFTAWNDAAAREVAVMAAQKTAKDMEQTNLKATVTGVPNGMDIRLKGYDLTAESPQVMQLEKTLKATYLTTIQNYAHQNMYRATQVEGTNRTNIQPDHPAIAIRYTAAMGPIAKAIMEQVPGAAQGPRPFINAALNWLQTIPYDTLQDRYSSNGAGFQTPYGLLQGNRGDCDTKATALAALIRAAYPQIPLAIIYVPDHAFLGIGIPQTSADYALQTEQGTFVLADATGPGLTPLGYIDTRTQSKIRAHETDLLPIH